MKQTVKTSRAAGQLEKMFRELNKHYFAGKLPEPIISLKKTPSAYVGITRNMNAYMILSQALTLIAENEDRLRAVEKEIYTPIADKTLRGPRAVQSTVRRASKVAWDLYPRSCSKAGWLSSEWSPLCRDYA